MKATRKDFAGSVSRAIRECMLFFFCGPDEAGAAAAANRLAAQLPDPGERIELSGAELKADPARLVDEARSVSLFGGARHLYLRVSGDEAHDSVKTFLEMADAGETSSACPVLIVASGATDKSRTAKLLSPRNDALVAMFWPPDLRDVTREVRDLADAAGVPMAEHLAARLARSCGLDIRLAQSEITKLAIYLDASPQSPCGADAAALDAIGGSTEEDGLMPLVDAVLSGDAARVPAEIRRMHEMALNPVAVALALERRAAQLARLAAKLGNSRDIASLLKSERVFFRDQPALTRQLKHWNAHGLSRLIPRLTRLHRALLSDSNMAEVLLAQALVEITRAASPRNSAVS